MVVGCADNRVESIGAAPVALDREHRGEVVLRGGLIGRIMRDRALGRARLGHCVSTLRISLSQAV